MEAAEGRERAARNTLTHDLWKRRDQLLCRRCGRLGRTMERRDAHYGAKHARGMRGGKRACGQHAQRQSLLANIHVERSGVRQVGLHTHAKPTKIPDAPLTKEGLADD